MKRIFLETQNVQAARECMAVLNDVEKGDPGLGIWFGQAGRGKTVAGMKLAVEGDMIYLRCLGWWTRRSMFSALCFQINRSQPFSIQQSYDILLEELDKNPRPILVDEADRLQSINMIDDLRSLHDQTGVPVVLIGEQGLYARLSAHRQLWSRVTRSVEFKAIRVEDIILFGIRSATLTVEPQAAHLMARRSDGDFRLVLQDIRDLERMAKTADTDTVNIRMVEHLPNRKPAPTGGK